VKAKAAGAISFPGMPQEVFDELPNNFELSEIGETPEGWSIRSVGDAATMLRDSLTPGDYPDEAFDHFSIPAFDKGCSPLVETGVTIKSNKLVVKPNCVLVSKLNPRIQRVWLPDDNAIERRRIASTEFLVLSPNDSWAREYLYCQIMTADFQERMAGQVTGTSNSHQRVKPQDFLNMLIVDSKSTRIAFSNFISPLFDKVRSNLVQNILLGQLRDALIPKLLSGAIRVPIPA
jgi:type I restriction enzyme, S subunit